MTGHDNTLVQNHTERLTRVEQETKENTKDIKNLQEWVSDFQDETHKERKKIREELRAVESTVNNDINEIKLGQARIEGKIETLIARLDGRKEATDEISQQQYSNLSLKYGEISAKYGKWMLILGVIAAIFAFFGINGVHI